MLLINSGIYGMKLPIEMITNYLIILFNVRHPSTYCASNASSYTAKMIFPPEIASLSIFRKPAVKAKRSAANEC